MSLIRMNNAQKLIRGEVKKFTSTELEPIASDIEKECRVPQDVLRKISEMGLFSLTVPDEYGGSGLDMTSLCVALEELSQSCASLAIMVAVSNSMVVYPLVRYGSIEVKKEYLGKVANGNIGGYAPCSDIEVSGRECIWESEGEKIYISNRYDIVLNGGIADFFVIPVKRDQGLALYVIEKGVPGVNSYAVTTMGLRGAGITGLEFKHKDLTREKCFVAAESGNQAIQSIVDNAHIGFSAIALGLTESALEASKKYARERKQFGRAIAEFPMIQEMLAEMRLTVEKSRLLVYEAADRFDSNEEFRLAARIACLTSCQGAVQAALKAIQVHGGYGYTKDYPVERFFRDAKSLQLLGETPVDLKTKIAKEILL
jgi:alkylation response protein AidB-like acyl-CoA dehydrogenase